MGLRCGVLSFLGVSPYRAIFQRSELPTQIHGTRIVCRSSLLELLSLARCNSSTSERPTTAICSISRICCNNSSWSSFTTLITSTTHFFCSPPRGLSLKTYRPYLLSDCGLPPTLNKMNDSSLPKANRGFFSALFYLGAVQICFTRHTESLVHSLQALLSFLSIPVYIHPICSRITVRHLKHPCRLRFAPAPL